MSDPRDSHDHAPREDADLRAAELALGLLSGTERRDAERLQRLDAGFGARVAQWDERLSPLLSGIAPVEPPAALWEGIERDLSRMTRTVAPRAVDPRRGLVPAFWRPFALGATAFFAASLACIAILSVPEPAPQPMTASIVGEGSVPLYTAVVYPGREGATLIPVTTASAPGHSHELWIIAPGDAPHSLGVMKPGTLRIEIAPELLSRGGVLAISLEPIGGSPTGQPTGPVVAKGELSRI
ncbi:MULTISPECIES: anti-sigma factor domain-containing protein [unclassified Aureimonas]|uniref:anti-sigma factor n=1 Tax=unclassified Aureimonas TaxID=2615206 RepID=UPI0006FD7DE1|nr:MULTISPECIES: anti-sigma factor [unclassified Aureimonas]KQT64231.1 hypothetical protein ASG62_04355 [Aureimonas sp. Leaf427]KQT81421.1 hypothetical protein ASG54_01625 [Aureimonas sp. Leaf460]